VTDYSEAEIEDALARLQQDRLVWKVTGARAPRWDHNLEGVLEISRSSKALLTVLFLRGPQTVAELRARTERLYDFQEPDELEATLRWLASREVPMVRQLERQPGQKEARWAQLLSGEPVLPTISDAAPVARRGSASALEERVAELENGVAELRAEIEGLKRLIEG
jgi:uncharacterized protein YceH (UPF0502 family)